MIRVGILGCASIARRSLIPAFAGHPAFKVALIASRDPAGVAVVAGQYECSTCTYDELVESADVDLIYCPLPTGLHHAWVKRCLEAGKHVLCEKSLACSFCEAEDLVNTARRCDRFLMESFQFRFHAQNLFVRRLLEEGAIGALRQVVVRFGIPPFPDGRANIRYSRELGGGALLDNGAYTIKATTYLLGKDVNVKASHRVVPQGEEVDIFGTLCMESAQGVVSQTAYGFDHWYRNGYDIWGTKGVITTSRAFTARPDFTAEVHAETSEGHLVETFKDDHFARLLDYVSSQIGKRQYDNEYDECLAQARLMQQAMEMS